MSILRRILGVFVMIAGLLGLVLSLAGIVGLWMVRPQLTTSLKSTIQTLTLSIDTSQKAMDVTHQALGATVTSVDELSKMLGTTATTVEETQPVLTQVNDVTGKTLPATFTAATSSLKAAQEAANSLEEAIQSFELFRAILGTNPILAGFLPANSKPYSPEKPLAESLGDLSTSLEAMPATFESMSANMDKADDNLTLIQSNLSTMSDSVGLISGSLKEYQGMIGESRASMESLRTMLTGFQANLQNIIDVGSLVMGLFFLWLLAAQVVIFSQGLELYRGTAGRMEGGEPAPAPAAGD